jgi:hypothetical protein
MNIKIKIHNLNNKQNHTKHTIICSVRQEKPDGFQNEIIQ